MKTRIIFISLAFLFLGASAFAQNMAFRVLASKGTNNADGKALRVGSKIMDNQSITIGADSYLGLAHVSGKTLEMNAQGTYKIADLTQKLAGSSSLASKYVDFVASELTKKDDANAMARRYKHMSKTGAVERGSVLEPIVVMHPKKANIIGQKALITWYLNESLPAVNPENVTGYKFVVSDLFGNILQEQSLTLKQTSMLIDMTDEKFKMSAGITYKVIAVGDETLQSSEQLIKRMNKRASSKYGDYKALAENNTALGKILQAKYLEEQGLFVDAQAAYNDALAIQPDVEEFQTLYKEFLTRNKMDKESFSDTE